MTADQADPTCQRACASAEVCDRSMQAAAWIAMNGVGLALVMPCAQSIMAEAFPSQERGRAFGMLFTLSAFGEWRLPSVEVPPAMSAPLERAWHAERWTGSQGACWLTSWPSHSAGSSWARLR